MTPPTFFSELYVCLLKRRIQPSLRDSVTNEVTTTLLGEALAE